MSGFQYRRRLPPLCGRPRPAPAVDAIDRTGPPPAPPAPSPGCRPTATTRRHDNHASRPEPRRPRSHGRSDNHRRAQAPAHSHDSHGGAKEPRPTTGPGRASGDSHGGATTADQEPWIHGGDSTTAATADRGHGAPPWPLKPRGHHDASTTAPAILSPHRTDPKAHPGRRDPPRRRRDAEGHHDAKRHN